MAQTCGIFLYLFMVFAAADKYLKNIPPEDRQFLLSLGNEAEETELVQHDAIHVERSNSIYDLFNCEIAKVGYCPEEVKSLKSPRSQNSLTQLTYKMDYEYLNGFVNSTIIAAIHLLQQETCLKFTEVDTDSEDEVTFSFMANEASKECYLRYEKQDSKIVGRNVFLSEKCFNTSLGVDSQLGQIHHFIMLGLGFSYEHTRSDRDDHIKVYYDYIADDKKSSFEKDNQTTSYVDEYDYSSVLHPFYNFLSSKPSAATILPKTKAKLGQREKLSDTDRKKIRRKFCGSADSVPQPDSPVGGESGCPVPSPVQTVTQTITKTATETTTVTVDRPIIGNVGIQIPTYGLPPPPQKVDDQVLQSSLNLPCKRGTFIDLQTQVQTTLLTNVDNEDNPKTSTLWTTLYQTRSVEGNLQRIDPTDTIYPEFEGGVRNVQTLLVNPYTIVLQTIYNDIIPNSLTTVQKRKTESKIYLCTKK